MQPLTVELRKGQPVDLPLLIGNEWMPALSGEKFSVDNPATGETIGYAAKAGKKEAIAALEAAARAFPAWATSTPDERAKILKKAGELVLGRQDILAEVLTMEQGKPLRDSKREVQASAETLIYYGEEARRISGEVAPSRSKNTRSLVIRQPVGVVAAIAPWNYPMSLTAWKVGPALAAGCTLVVKPTSETPLASALFVAACAEAGAPAGVVNIVTGPSPIVGEELITNPLTQMIAFTGSTEVGRHILAKAVPGLKKCMLELGGHAAFVVFKDANFGRAVKDGVRRSFRNMGQICNAVNRIFVDQSIYDRYVKSFVEETKKLTIGNGLLNPDIDLGPMANQEGIDRTQRHIDDAITKGAKLLCGGKRPNRADLEKGFFYEPSIVVDVKPDMLVMHEETFGPLVAIAPFDGLENALKLANSTEYGLVNYAYTNDLSTIIRYSEGIETGTIAINNVSPDTLYAPYAAWKQSGLGVELSHYGIEEYLQVKHVVIEFE